jgi:hypothetical protein
MIQGYRLLFNVNLAEDVYLSDFDCTLAGICFCVAEVRASQSLRLSINHKLCTTFNDTGMWLVVGE